MTILPCVKNATFYCILGNHAHLHYIIGKEKSKPYWFTSGFFNLSNSVITLIFAVGIPFFK